ncbi:MAG: hypothetical protein OSB57_08705 [Planctomycetota bacterium]|nr:hypothetical protein [Planctomycetota bacterium]
MGSSFTALDWSVVVAILVGTTVLGERLAGRQRSVRDFFLGGRSLPWFAVAASIVATEISAVTYISLPSVVYRDGGNMHYLQIVLIGSLLARLFVGYVLVPAYYEREIYSPYDYVARRLGERARGMTTALFTLGGILGQSARVYLTALVLEILLAEELAILGGWTGCAPLTCAVALIGVVAVLWTWIGGIATVIWTDVVLFFLFIVGIAVSLWTVHNALAGVGSGLPEALVEGWRAGKFEVINTSTDLSQPYTLWVALFVASFGQIGPYGCDQLMAQRLFCCRGPKEARKAIVASIAAVGIIAAVALVGVALWAYYKEFPLSAASEALVLERTDRIFPIFVMEVVGPGLKGLVIVGALAAAISSLDSILAALSQTTLATVYLPRRQRELTRRGMLRDEEDEAEAQRTLRVSRALVLGWGVVLCAAAVGVDRVADRYDSLLDLALAMAGYTGGALLGAFFLAFLPIRARGRGLVWSAPLSVLAVFALAWHEPWAMDVVHGGFGLMGLVWVVGSIRSGVDLRGTLALLLGFALVECLCRYGALPGGKSLPWPWYIPLGTLVTFLWALFLDSGDEPAVGADQGS